jgi:hypothetical protein
MTGTLPKKYMAGWVPRYLRQSKLGHLPIDCVICTQTVRGSDNTNHYTDLVMLPDPEFQRMQSYLGLQHVLTMAPRGGESFDPFFVIKNPKHVTVPKDHPNPEAYARAYFLIEFGVLTPDKIAIEDNGIK